MKIAAFNVENLFERARIFNEPISVSTEINNLVTELSDILEKETYSVSDKERIKELLIELGLEKSDQSKYLLLRQNRGKLLSRPHNGPVEVVANGRNEWIGWIEFKSSPTNEIAIMNTARVIKDVNADIMVVIEADNRIALKQYSEILLSQIEGSPYDEVMIIDGNDDRGIDVGIMTKNGYQLGVMQSHVHDKNAAGNPIFSRDCPEFLVTTPNQEEIWVLPNHFKSKYGGNDASSKNRRLSQANRVKEIYERLIREGKENVVVLGDLNDTPNSNELRPLIIDTDLQEVSNHPAFNSGEFHGIGTYGLGNDSNKIDYILLSPTLFARIKSCGLFRKGAYPGKRPKRWTVYPELVDEIHAASDHHLIWVEFN